MLVVGEGSNFVFSGDGIKVVGPLINNPGDPYNGIVPNITVSNNAKATFYNAVDSPSLKIENNATATLVYTAADSGQDTNKFTFANGVDLAGSTATLVLEQEDNTPDAVSVFKPVISGNGNLEKTGPGAITFEPDSKHTYNGVVSSVSGEIVGGATHVKQGRLVVVDGLGNGGEEFEFKDIIGVTRTSDRNYIGAIKVDKNATLRFTGQFTGDGQRLGGHIGQDYNTTADSDGYTYTPAAEDGTIEVNGGYYEIAAARNSFQGKLIIGESNSSSTHLNISGGIGTIKETFDGGTSFEASYYHNRYAGDMDIKGASVLEFSYNGDYQSVSGKLTGTGELRINSGMPFYFGGDAANFSGKTVVDGNSGFHLNTGTTYGNGATGSAFTVKDGSALYVGNNGKIHTENFAMEKNTMLVVNPGKFTINANQSLAFGVAADNNITLVFRVSQSDFAIGHAPTTNAEAAAVTNTKLTVTAGDGVVLYSKITLRVDAFGFIPQPSQDNNGYFTLMDGLGALSDSDPENSALAMAIFGQNELYIMNTRFAIYFINGKLIASQIECRGVPEPSTYGLFSGIFIASLSILQRRRKKKEKKEKYFF
jgi:hypothetical protein